MNPLASGLAPHIESLLTVKHALGFPYTTSEQHLRSFDRMCAERFPGEGTLTRQMVAEWTAARPGEHVNGQMRRITPVRQLAKHMARAGASAHVVPAGIPGRQIRYTPHVFTHAQLRALFDAADRVRPSPYGGPRHLVIPALFRTVYCLGLRPGEARRLEVGDVDLGAGSVFVRESKGHKDRIVYMSEVLSGYLRSYDQEAGAVQPGRAAFFPNRYGLPYSSGTISCWLHELLDAAGVAAEARPGSPIRPYDLRHSHVVEVVNREAAAGRDPEALVPYLAAQLGHANLADTWYYFHLAADFHPQLRRMANQSVETAFPEVDDGRR
jgi:integrase